MGYAASEATLSPYRMDVIAHRRAPDCNDRLRIGVIEDDPVHREIVSTMLARAGFEVHAFANTLDFKRHRGTAGNDLLLVDWELPQETGLEFLIALRQSGEMHLPVIFLTACEDEALVVRALEAGADDYLVKPANPAILVARVRAALRRTLPAQVGPRLEFDPFCFLLSQRRLLRDGVEAKLTPREFDLLLYLFRRMGRIASREALLSQVWHVGPEVNTRAIDTYVSRLRKRLGLAGESGWKLERIYQHGYRLAKVEPTMAST